MAFNFIAVMLFRYRGIVLVPNFVLLVQKRHLTKNEDASLGFRLFVSCTDIVYIHFLQKLP